MLRIDEKGRNEIKVELARLEEMEEREKENSTRLEEILMYV